MGKTCTVDGCDRPFVARGYCHLHWQRWRHHGSADWTPPLGRAGRPTCSIEGCDGLVKGRGWCGRHYERWRRHGSPDWEPPQSRSVAERLQDNRKRCSRCGTHLPLDAFYCYKGSPDGRTSKCKACSNATNKAWKRANPEHMSAWNRKRYSKKDRDQINARDRQRRTTLEGRRATLNQRLRQDHGLTLVDYERMVAAQDGLCQICGLPPMGESHADERLHVDHDHATGAIRGLLCRYCNTGLGLLGDDQERIAAAIAYLAESSAAT